MSNYTGQSYAFVVSIPIRKGLSLVNKLGFVTYHHLIMDDYQKLLNQNFGEPETEKRRKFEKDAEDFMAEKLKLGEKIRELRKEKNMTQEELAEKIGTKKTYISRIERGQSDIQLGTLNKLSQIGFDQKVWTILKSVDL